jgi:Polyketide cyclase / dehydrase and lipid transport
VKHRAIGAILGALLPIATWAQSPWIDDQTVQQQLTAGQVAVRITFDGDESRMRVHAAVRINASPEIIWRVLTDCEHAATFIPGVKRCRRMQSAPDGSWELIEQEAKYSWLMPPITSVVRADYKRPQRIDFKRVSGDLKDEEGDWLLEPAAAVRPPSASWQALGETTIVEYELYVDPGFWIPRVLLRHSLRTELPAALTAVRARAESTAAER